MTMESPDFCSLKFRRAFTDIEKLSTDVEDRSITREIPRFFKQKSFASPFLPKFNKPWNNRKYSEIFHANQVVLEHFKFQKRLQSRLNNRPNKESPFSTPETVSHKEAAVFKEKDSKGDTYCKPSQPFMEIPKPLLLLPRLERKFTSNENQKNNSFNPLYKKKTTTQNNNGSDVKSGILTLIPNAAKLQNIFGNLNLIDPAERSGNSPSDADNSAPDISSVAPLITENSRWRHSSRISDQVVSSMTNLNQKLNKDPQAVEDQLIFSNGSGSSLNKRNDCRSGFNKENSFKGPGNDKTSNIDGSRNLNERDACRTNTIQENCRVLSREPGTDPNLNPEQVNHCRSSIKQNFNQSLNNDQEINDASPLELKKGVGSNFDSDSNSGQKSHHDSNCENLKGQNSKSHQEKDQKSNQSSKLRNYYLLKENNFNSSCDENSNSNQGIFYGKFEEISTNSKQRYNVKSKSNKINNNPSKGKSRENVEQSILDKRNHKTFDTNSNSTNHSGNDSIRNSLINKTNNCFNSSMNILPSEPKSFLSTDLHKQNGVCNFDLNYGNDGPDNRICIEESRNSEFPKKIEKRDPTTIDEVRSFLDVDFLKVPPREALFSSNEVTTASMKRKFYNGEISPTVFTNSTNLFQICVWADREMYEECQSLQTNLFPKLKLFGQQMGVQIEIYDLHLKKTDPPFLDSFRVDLFNEILEKCFQNGYQTRILILLGEGRHSGTLPSFLSSQEFKMLRNFLNYRQQQDDDLTHQDVGLPRTLLRSSFEDSNRFTKDSESPDHDSLKTVLPGNQSSSLATLQLLTSQTRLNILAEKATNNEDSLDMTIGFDEGNGDGDGYVEGQSDADCLYWLDKHEGKEIYKLKKFRFAESESNKWKEQINSTLEICSKINLMAEDEFCEQPSLTSSILSSASCLSKKIETVGSHFVCFVRNDATTMADSVDSSDVNHYFQNIDGAGKDEISERRAQKMNEIRNNFITTMIRPGNLVELQLDRSEEMSESVKKRQFALYANRIQEKLFGILSADIASTKTEPEDKLVQEVLNHVTFCQQRVKQSCLIQKPILEAIASYIKSNKSQVFILHGPDGSGKTTLISWATVCAKLWTKSVQSAKIRILVRVIGHTRNSTDICELLHGLCIQLQNMLHISAFVPTNFPGLVNQFLQILNQVDMTEKLFIFLDGIDLLQGTPERTLLWIPKILPSNVRLVISTRSQDNNGCLKFLLEAFAEADFIFKGIPPLNETDAETLLNFLQERHKWVLQPRIKSKIIEEPIRFPLMVTLQVAEYLAMESVVGATTLPELPPPDPKEIIVMKFKALEERFGCVFVYRVIGYLSAARFGLAINEMEDILIIDRDSADQKLSLYQLFSFLSELQPYLLERIDGNIRVLSWGHKIFYKAAQERYLKNSAQALAYHRNLAVLFSRDPSVIEDQKILSKSQPDLPDRKELRKLFSNCRRLGELLYHLLQSKQLEVFTKYVFSFQWIQEELCAKSFANLIEHLTKAQSFEPLNTELLLLTVALHLSEPVLTNWPDQFSSQLIGRLSSLASTTIETTLSKETLKYPNLARLVDSARQASYPALIPMVTCLQDPLDEISVHLYGHIGSINAIDLTTDGRRLLTASQDNSIKVWDTQKGQVVQSMFGIGARVSSLAWALADTRVVTVEPYSVKVWSLSDPNYQYKFETSGNFALIATLSNIDQVPSALLVTICGCQPRFNVWDLQTGCSQTFQIALKGKCVHQSSSILLARNSQSSCFLYSFRDSNHAVLQNATDGKIIHFIQCRDVCSMVVGLAIAPGYLVLACRKLYHKTQEIHHLELFDPGNGLYLRRVWGCVHDAISGPLTVPRGSSNVVALSRSVSNNNSTVVVWNLETESHKHLAKHSGISELLACNSIEKVFTVSKGSNIVKQWDISKGINKNSAKFESVPNTVRISPVQSESNCFFTFTMNNGPIGLWTVSEDSLLTNLAMTPEEGFLDPSDVVLVNDRKLVILTDRNLPDANEAQSQIFQTILIYDIKTSFFDHKSTGCYIDVFPRHDYAILPGDRLMGLSNSRGHFIIWSLMNGQVVRRIKPNFKASLNTVLNKVEVKGSSDARMTSWEQRNEPGSGQTTRGDCEREKEKQRLEELKREKERPVDSFLISGNKQILLASYFAHHLYVFEIETQQHLVTIEDPHALLLLGTADITPDGSHFVHATYDESSKTGYVTLRETRTGRVRKRLKNEKDVCAVALSDRAHRIVVAKHTNEIHVWDPMIPNSLRKRKLPKSMKLDFDSRLYLISGGQRAVLLLANQVSLWDLNRAEIIAAFTPDNQLLCCNIISQREIIVLGFSDKTGPVVLKIKNDVL